MYIEIVRPADQRLSASVAGDFNFLSPEYRALFAASGATAFQSPLWLDSLYAVLARRMGARPHVVTLRDRARRLRMVIPLVLQRAAGINILQPADLGVSDYNAFVADKATHELAASDPDLIGQIRQCLAPADVLIFRKIQRCPKSVAALFRGTETLNDNAGYELALGVGTFDEWQKAALKKKFRNGIRRKLQGLQEAHGSVETVTFSDRADIERAIRFIRDLRTARFADDILHNEAYLDFYTRVAVMGAESGEAVTSGLLVNGELVSADFGIVNDNAHHAILCASRIDEYGHYSPGLQSLFAMIRRSHENGRARFDFGIGKTRQKSDFGSTEIPLYNLTVARSMKGKAVSLVYNQAKPLKTLLRRIDGRLR